MTTGFQALGCRGQVRKRPDGNAELAAPVNGAGSRSHTGQTVQAPDNIRGSALCAKVPVHEEGVLPLDMLTLHMYNHLRVMDSPAAAGNSELWL